MKCEIRAGAGGVSLAGACHHKSPRAAISDPTRHRAEHVSCQGGGRDDGQAAMSDKRSQLQLPGLCFVLCLLQPRNFSSKFRLVPVRSGHGEQEISYRGSFLALFFFFF